VDIWGAITVLVRRYYVTVPVAAIALVFAWIYAGSVAPEYHASASLIMIGPTAQVVKDVPQPVNPYASLGTATVASALGTDVTTPQSLQQVVQAGNSTNFSVSERGRAPILDITTTSKSPRQAVTTATQVISIIQTTLAARQQPYAPNKANQITVQVLSSPALAAIDTKSRTKAKAVAIGVAIAISVLLTLLIDGILRARSRHEGRRFWIAPSIEESTTQRPGHVVIGGRAGDSPVVRP
jgi:hypothetical protein